VPSPRTGRFGLLHSSDESQSRRQPQPIAKALQQPRAPLSTRLVRLLWIE